MLPARNPRPPSLAKLTRDLGDRWVIDQIPCAAPQWIAVLQESGGDYGVMVAVHDIHALRFRTDHTERDEPEKCENVRSVRNQTDLPPSDRFRNLFGDSVRITYFALAWSKANQRYNGIYQT